MVDIKTKRVKTENVSFYYYYIIGVSGESGLFIGVKNPASIKLFTQTLKSLKNLNSNVIFPVKFKNAWITSLTSNPQEDALFAAIQDSIYIYHNFSTWQNDSAKITILFKGRSSAFGQIAIDFVSNNLYWCDSLFNWIAMKPAFNANHLNYKVVVHRALNQPEGLALDPADR